MIHSLHTPSIMLVTPVVHHLSWSDGVALSSLLANIRDPRKLSLSQPSCLTLRLKQAEDVILTNYRYLSVMHSKPIPPSYHIPGPFTLRMMLRVVSSMNSTRTCVTPPREPFEWLDTFLASMLSRAPLSASHTGTTEHSGDLNELDWDSAGRSAGGLVVMLLSCTYFCESIFSTVRSNRD